MSLVTQTISLFNSIDLDSQPKPLSQLITLLSQKVSLDNNAVDTDLEFSSLLRQIFLLDPQPELVLLICEIVFLVVYSQFKKLISLRPQVTVRLRQGKFHVDEEPLPHGYGKWRCLPKNWEQFRLAREEATHFLCGGWNGKNHERYDEAPVEIKHLLHPKHFLQLVLLNYFSPTRKCYCCDEDLIRVFYYCAACDFAINIACAEKPPVLYINHPRWHEHTLAWFPRRASLVCNVCALPDSTSPIYMCPPCDFVVHLKCLSLPRVIRISRHLHRIGFTQSFDQGDWSCGVCRTKIDNDCGGYSCTKTDCSYTAHSRCATQMNVWDGLELEGEPEEIEEKEVEPFVRISDGIIQHFTHQHHHLRLNENTGRDYDEDKVCEACVMPIYFGKFYSCMQCEFILHEICANFPRKTYSPIHPHLLTLVVGYDDVRGCATLPEKVRYKHDAHMLTLSYSKETSTMMYWCEACEGEVKPKERFYTCDEYCCVTLHIECLLGKDLYMKPGSSFLARINEKFSSFVESLIVPQNVVSVSVQILYGSIVTRERPMAELDGH
ncbi:Cysteine/Histidine-rich C1 domain family protein [Raphanus sativus]|nr:Cysteine/Histidine-rich C1 domain family protein [Raphanus sativus]